MAMPLRPHDVCWVCGTAYARLSLKPRAGHHSILGCLSHYTDVSRVSGAFASFNNAWADCQARLSLYRWATRHTRCRPSPFGAWRIRYCQHVWLVEYVRTVPLPRTDFDHREVFGIITLKGEAPEAAIRRLRDGISPL